MFYELELNKPLSQVQEAFKKAVEEVGFSILHHYHFSKALKDRGYPIEGELFIYDICNPSYAQAVLKKCIRLGCLIPCRVSIYHEGGKTRVNSLSPLGVLEALRMKDPKLADELEPVIREVDEVMRKIIDSLRSL